MDLDARLQLSYYETVSEINAEHGIFLVRHRENGRFFVKKFLAVYHPDVFHQLMDNPIHGLPKIHCLCEEDGKLTVIEEFISGITLEDLLTEKGSLPIQTVIQYSIELCEILSALHALRPPIIHRDIKPSNMVLTPDGHIILLDLNASRPDVSKEEDTHLLGTKGYAAPEQYGFGSSNERTDVYAMGMMMNTLLWGHYEHQVYPKNPLRRIIDKCTRIDPKKRYRNVKKLLNELKILAIPNNYSKLPPYKSSLLPPGFRTGTFTHMLISVIGYLFFVWYSFSLVIVGVEGGLRIFSRIFLFLSCIFMVLLLCNYRGLRQRIMPLTTSKYMGLRFLGSVILIIIFPLALYVLLIAIITMIQVW